MIVIRFIKAVVLWAVLDVLHMQDLYDRLKRL
jgi:hypothetical protein